MRAFGSSPRCRRTERPGRGPFNVIVAGPTLDAQTPPGRSAQPVTTLWAARLFQEVSAIKCFSQTELFKTSKCEAYLHNVGDTQHTSIANLKPDQLLLFPTLSYDCLMLKWVDNFPIWRSTFFALVQLLRLLRH